MKIEMKDDTPEAKDTALQLVAETKQDEEEILAHRNAAYFDVGPELPSRTAFYAFNHLSIRPYNAMEVIKLGAAAKSGKIQYVVEAVASTIDKPVNGLLLADFMFLCFWLRTMSYKKTPFTLNWTCEATSHEYKVLNNELDPKTLLNSIVMTKTDLRVNMLDTQAVEEPITKLYDAGIVCFPQTVDTFLELHRISSSPDGLSDEDTFLLPYASILAAGSHGKSVLERVAFLKTLQDKEDGVELLELLETVSQLFKSVGVHETINVECQHCRVKQEVTPQVDLLSFFPFGK